MAPLLDLTVHFSDWASQPDVHILCDDSCVMPSWGRITLIQRSLERHAIYRADDERFYTFKREKVTCKACRAKMKGRKEHSLRMRREVDGSSPPGPTKRS